MTRILLETLDNEPIDQRLAAPVPLQMGPVHPAMNGTVKLRLELDGETVERAEVEVGYLHRGFEKSCERATWTQVLPYTDRLNYVSPLCNNVGYALAVEKLLDVEVPERCKYIRMVMAEMSRIGDHLTCVGAVATHVGAHTAAMYAIEAREALWRLTERVTGARLTHSYTRIGGLAADLPEGVVEDFRDVERRLRCLIDDVKALLDGNRIFIDRLQQVGCVAAERAKAWGFTGPVLRACGVDYDVRKAHPYLLYDRMTFEVPIGRVGDSYDRHLVRMAEIDQSIAIIDQCFEQMGPGPINVDDPRLVLPPKQQVSGSIEGTIAHFKILTEGIQVPPGEVYSYTEAGNGELGFYLVSVGGGRPYKCRVRSPCWSVLQALPEMLRGHQVGDVMTTFGSINVIGGECDR